MLGYRILSQGIHWYILKEKISGLKMGINSLEVGQVAQNWDQWPRSGFRVQK